MMFWFLKDPFVNRCEFRNGYFFCNDAERPQLTSRAIYTGCVRLTRVRLYDEESGLVASQSQLSRTHLRPRNGRAFFSLRISCRVDRPSSKIIRK
ncbi:hypothetical protein Y032_0002g893 [Ancylostoma ceylanicum]|uniref:Uncharacterized protein n=1 Tax=Ancylostoma ceylanicum TaxID=53326 RepID=A0A016W1A4_9BILA|nr:hypothetical protein Y032_0002g893 [Ancylostoma ceylanicum]